MNKNDAADTRLRDVVERGMPEADPDTVSIVTACAGLLACIAYADRAFSAEEMLKAGRLLATVNGIGGDGSDAIVGVLSSHVLELSSVHAARFARTLNELGSRELRLHVLGMLLELAAVDDELSPAEVITLRQVTRSLGLTQEDYNQLQNQHREKLGALRRPS
jgi:uncharacterized tellurite resistance protein B-like protein